MQCLSSELAECADGALVVYDRASDEAELLSLAAAGDERAWDALVERHTPTLWSVARSYRLDRAGAADAVQTAWLWLAQRLDRLDDPAALAAALVATVRRECVRTLRRHELARLAAGERAPAGWRGLPAPRPAGGGDRNAALWRAYRQLPERCQRMLRLQAAGPMSAADLAAALNLPVGTVAPTMSGCLARLRALLDEPAPVGDRPRPAD